MKRILLALVLCAACMASYAADLRPVTDAFAKGQAGAMQTYMDTAIDMHVAGTDKKCTAGEAVKLLADFFGRNQPKTFTLLHNADKKDSGFSVGTLETAGATFRVNLTYRIQDNTVRIQSIRIE